MIKTSDIYLKLHPDVVIQLTLLDEFLSKNLSSVSIPQHIPLLISRFEKESQQLEVTYKAIKLIKSQKITDSKFVWPSLKELKIIFGQPKNTKSFVITPKDMTPLPKERKLSEYLVKHSKNIICIPGNKTHPTYLINKKTNSISIVTSKKSIISLENIHQVKIYVLNPQISKFLQADKLPLKISEFSNHDTLITQGKNIHSPGIIISQ